METVDVYTERDDLVTYSDCDKVMLLPYGADKYPACKKEGYLIWTDENLRKADIDSLLEKYCSLHQKSELRPEEYLSLSILVTEHIPCLADKPQTVRETLFLLLETGSLFEKYWRDTRYFQSENIYTLAIETLLDKPDVELREGDAIPIGYQDCRSPEDFFRVVTGGCPAKEGVSFPSDKEGSYYFNGCKAKVENSDEYAYRLLKTKIQANYRRPVDFYFRFLARFGPYGAYGNVYRPSIADLIYRRYLPETAKWIPERRWATVHRLFYCTAFLISVIVVTALATTVAPVQFDFQNNSVEVMTLDTLRRTHKENNIYGSPFKGIYHYEVIEYMTDIYQKHNLDYEVEEISAAQNKNKAQPGVIVLSQVEQKYGAMAVEAHILRHIYTTIRIKERETGELATTLVIAFHQDGIQAAIGPCVRVCHNQYILSPERSVSNYGKDRATAEEPFGRVDEWLSNFEVQMNEDRECIRRPKARVITPVETYTYIRLLTALRMSHDSPDKRLSSKVETYPLNQSQISIFTEDLLRLTEERKTLTAWDICSVTTEIYKPGRADIPAMIPQNGTLAELILSEGLPES